MSGYRIEQLTPDYWLVKRQGVKVAIVFPANAEGRLAIYPHPETYPDLCFTGLPDPLLPEWMTFGSMREIEAFLGIEQRAEAA